MYPFSTHNRSQEITAGESSSHLTVTNMSMSSMRTVASSDVKTVTFAVIIVHYVVEARIVSASSGVKSFLPTMCTDAPESTLNSFPFVDHRSASAISNILVKKKVCFMFLCVPFVL